MVCHLMDRRGTVFLICPHFSFETNTIVFMSLLTFTDRVKKHRFFFLIWLFEHTLTLCSMSRLTCNTHARWACIWSTRKSNSYIKCTITSKDMKNMPWWHEFYRYFRTDVSIFTITPVILVQIDPTKVFSPTAHPPLQTLYYTVPLIHSTFF